jgi:hypothetical protein
MAEERLVDEHNNHKTLGRSLSQALSALQPHICKLLLSVRKGRVGMESQIVEMNIRGNKLAVYTDTPDGCGSQTLELTKENVRSVFGELATHVKRQIAPTQEAQE